ncbi:chemotaxis protein CheB [Nannocystis sp. ILAH1]|uniref:chemotaxis protein CheB n=1 Tax=unclassified Nannocystis TaxID=2627009 RepID=UPI00226DBD19|nr:MULTISPECIES: chemotaxis protein CheB [unclassified Nannocystis]MCY0990476.1 chemotaxis protein CheB [Nannocystis sp. ILAH1]MCY1069236.1 chemotaxis protein CheB [Nannocystis sp. RBIL2]
MATRNIHMIVIGGSSGALDALAALLPALPPGYPLPLAVVLHLPPTQPSHLVEVLRTKASLPTREPDDKEPIVPSTVYVAPPNYHLLVERGRSFSLSVDRPVLFSRPSIDVLFESAADAFGPHLAGVLLSGANEDGARGLGRIAEAGGLTIVESPATAAVPIMPAAALQRVAIDHAVPAAAIGTLLARLAAPTRSGEAT